MSATELAVLEDSAGSLTSGDPELLRKADALALETERLKDLALIFERWHTDMASMAAQVNDMHSKGEDLISAARQLIMVSLNATIEAARAGAATQGFALVAAEVKKLSHHVRALSTDIGKTLYGNVLTTTATYQDIQAGGKMMMAAIVALDAQVRDLRSRIGSR
jgi:methyl-accepting chemotaxis protein